MVMTPDRLRQILNEEAPVEMAGAVEKNPRHVDECLAGICGVRSSRKSPSSPAL